MDNEQQIIHFFPGQRRAYVTNALSPHMLVLPCLLCIFSYVLLPYLEPFLLAYSPHSLVLLILVAATMLLLPRALREIRYYKLRHALPVNESSAGHRLQCVGHPDQVMPYGPLPSPPFEPRVFYTLGVIPLFRRLSVIVLVMTVPFTVGAFYLLIFLTSDFPDPFSDLPLAHACALLLGFACAFFCVHLLYPTYVRISPQQIDIMRFSMFSRHIYLFKSFDLRHSHILVDLINSLVIVDDTTYSGSVIEFSIRLLPSRECFTYWLFAAATCEFSPPVLPRDEFVA